MEVIYICKNNRVYKISDVKRVEGKGKNLKLIVKNGNCSNCILFSKGEMKVLF